VTDPDSVVRDSTAVIVVLSIWAKQSSVNVWAVVRVKTLPVAVIIFDGARVESTLSSPS